MKKKQKTELLKNKLEKEQPLLSTEQEISSLKQEINNLENEIKQVKVKNLKNKTIRNLKIFARTVQLASPLVLTAGITTGIFQLLGKTPIYLNDVKKNLHYMKELDNDGNIRIEKQYDNFEKTIATFKYIGKWEQQEDGMYTRTRQTYNIKDLTEDNVSKLFNGQLDIVEFLGLPKKNIIETKNKLTKEEINSKAYMQAIIYGSDDKDFIILKESISDNIFDSAIWVLVTALLESIVIFLRVGCSSFNFSSCISKIKENNPLIDTKQIIKKLELKKENYNKLKRN